MKFIPQPLFLSPPWGSVSTWQEANISIDFHINRYYHRLQPAMQIARDTLIGLESIFSCLDDLGQMTCPRCPDVCCLSASPWYDMRDLIFLHFNQLSIPRVQTIKNIKETCCYISHKGCTLPRIIRPWICTWYLCPAQTANTRKSKTGRWQPLNRVLEEIKILRKELEDEFIRVIRGNYSLRLMPD
jgi:hypothetical protein